MYLFFNAKKTDNATWLVDYPLDELLYSLIKEAHCFLSVSRVHPVELVSPLGVVLAESRFSVQVIIRDA